MAALVRRGDGVRFMGGFYRFVGADASAELDLGTNWFILKLIGGGWGGEVFRRGLMALSLLILPDPKDAAGMVWIQLVRTHAKIVRRLEQVLDGHSLTLPQFDVLATLSMGENITQQELAERLLVTKGNVCGVLDRMEKNSWVERREDSSDRRSNRLFLTGKGRRLLGKVMPEHFALLSQATGELAIGQLQQLYQWLDVIERSLDKIPAEGGTR